MAAALQITTAQIGKNATNENFDSSPTPTASPNSTAPFPSRRSSQRSKAMSASGSVAATAMSVVTAPAWPRIGGISPKSATAMSAVPAEYVRDAHHQTQSIAPAEKSGS